MKTIKLEDFGDELQKLALEAVNNIEKGVNEVAEDLLSASQKLAPLDEGGLMESGNVDKAVNLSGSIKASVGYNKEYALRMHEDFYQLGDTSARKSGFDGMQVGRKYLEQPLTIYGVKYIEYLTERMMS